MASAARGSKFDWDFQLGQKGCAFCMNEVWELRESRTKNTGGVVSGNIPTTCCVRLDSDSMRITFGAGRATLATHNHERRKSGVYFADRVENLDVVDTVMSPLTVKTPYPPESLARSERDHLAIEERELLNKVKCPVEVDCAGQLKTSSGRLKPARLKRSNHSLMLRWFSINC